MNEQAEPRRLDVFFYGLFMDDTLLREKGIHAQNRRLAALDDYALRIGPRATLVPQAGGRVHGLLALLTHDEVAALYADGSVSAYRAEAVTAKTADGRAIPALCFNIPNPQLTGEVDPAYVARLKELALRVGLPPSYVASIG